MSLTPKQKHVLDYIRSYTAEQGFSPSQTEIARYFGFRSLGTVQDYLNALERQGHLDKPKNAIRGIRMRPPSGSLPLLGRVAAGKPIESSFSHESIEVPPTMLRRGGEYFALEVKGDSMIDDGILEGDFVVIRKQADAANGERVVALINNEATIKRYYQRGETIELHASNPKYEPMVIGPDQEFKLEGIFVGLIRFEK